MLCENIENQGSFKLTTQAIEKRRARRVAMARMSPVRWAKLL